MRNIAIAGQMAAGKSTISSVLINSYGFNRGSFAARLKETMTAVYGDTPGELLDKSAEVMVQTLSGEDRVVDGRTIYQTGGQAMKAVDRLFWVRWFARDAAKSKGPFVIDDMRFTYEADYMKQQGWLIVRVETPEAIRRQRYVELYGKAPTEEQLNHESERDVPNIRPDLVVPGTGDAFAVASEIARCADERLSGGVQGVDHWLSEYCWCRPRIEHVS